MVLLRYGGAIHNSVVPRRKQDADKRTERPRPILRPLGEQLRRLRLDRRMSQETLAELANLNYKYIGRIELGKADPGAEVLVRLARALRVSVGELFHTVTPSSPAPPAIPPADLESVAVAFQALSLAVERLLAHHPAPTLKASRRLSR